MTINEFVDKMQSDLKNEYKHLHFYLQASFMLYGPERLYLGKWLSDQADSELGHVRQFAAKIRAFGKVPTTEYLKFNSSTDCYEILKMALTLEQEVVTNYHERLIQAESLNDKTGKYKDLVLFYEEQVEHSQEDIDEIVKLLGTTVL